MEKESNFSLYPETALKIFTEKTVQILVFIPFIFFKNSLVRESRSFGYAPPRVFPSKTNASIRFLTK